MSTRRPSSPWCSRRSPRTSAAGQIRCRPRPPPAPSRGGSRTHPHVQALSQPSPPSSAELGGSMAVASTPNGNPTVSLAKEHLVPVKGLDSGSVGQRSRLQVSSGDQRSSEGKLRAHDLPWPFRLLPDRYFELLSTEFLILRVLQYLFLLLSSFCRFMIITEMLKNIPIFKRLEARIRGKGSAVGVGCGRAVAMRAWGFIGHLAGLFCRSTFAEKDGPED